MKYLRSNVVCEAYVSISYPFLCTNSKPDADLCRKLAQYFGLIKKKKYWHVHDHFLRIIQNNTSVGFRCPFRLCLTNLTPFLSASQKK